MNKLKKKKKNQTENSHKKPIHMENFVGLIEIRVRDGMGEPSPSLP